MGLRRTGTAPRTARPGADIDPLVWRIAFTVIVGAMAVIFDTTIVSVALNDLAHDLHTNIASIQWVSTGYLLAMFITIPIAGWAQSVLGGKRLWILALCIFLLGSLLCACAWNAPSLIAFRILGVGGGLMMPLMMTLIMQAAGGRNIGTIMSVVTLPAAMGPILGPVLGGIILSFGDWRWLFLVNVPFCVVGAYLAYRNLPEDRPEGRTRLDWVGLLLLSPGVASIIYGLSRVEGHAGFGSARVLVPIFIGLLLIAAFLAWALPRGTRALVDVQLFRHRPLASSSALAFLTGASLYGALFLLPLYWQQLRGDSALMAGLLLIPQGVGTLVSRRLAGTLTDEIGPRRVSFAGFAITTIATIPFGFVTVSASNVPLMVALFVRGVGMGAATIPLAGAAFVGLTGPEIPSASIITRIVQQVGGSMGIAVLAVVLQTAGGAGGDPAQAFREAFWWSIGFTAIAVPLTLLLPGRPAPPTPAVVEAENEVATVVS